MIDEQIRTYLLTITGVTDIVGASGVFVERATQGTAPPYVVVTQDSGNPEHHAGGRSGINRAGVDVVCYAATAVKAGTLADAVETALTAKQTPMGTATVRSCLCEGKRRSSDNPQQGDQTGFPSVTLSFDLFYQ